MRQSIEGKAASEMKVGGAIRFLVNGRGLQLKCARVLHETACAYSCVWQ